MLLFIKIFIEFSSNWCYFSAYNVHNRPRLLKEINKNNPIEKFRIYTRPKLFGSAAQATWFYNVMSYPSINIYYYYY